VDLWLQALDVTIRCYRLTDFSAIPIKRASDHELPVFEGNVYRLIQTRRKPNREKAKFFAVPLPAACLPWFIC
jgi:hypothetical protein